MKTWHYICLILWLPVSIPAQDQVLQKIPELDSRYRETNLSITPNGKYLFFMSQRGGMPWSSARQSYHGHGPQYDGDIWYAVKQGGGWSTPRCLSANINTYSGEDEPNVTADGQAVYFQSWRNGWQTSGGPYYRASLNGTNWGAPIGLGGNITRFFRDLEVNLDKAIDDDLKEKGLYREYIKLSVIYPNSWIERLKNKGFDINEYVLGTDGMAISPDEKTMIVSVYEPQRKRYNLFISRRNNPGSEWSYPRTLNISNNSNDISVYIAGDNQTVYFASDRPGGMGGYDIYKTTLLEDASCTPPKNIGAPYNSRRDEYSFVVDPSEDKAYLVIDGAIHEVQLLEQAKPASTLVINGKVVNQLGQPLAARILLIDKAQPDNPLATAQSNSKTGEYAFSLAKTPGSYQQYATTSDQHKGILDFRVDAQTDNTLETTIVIDVPTETPIAIAPAPAIVQAAVVEALNKQDLAAGATVQVDQLFFKADATEIEPASYQVLDQIAQTLNSRPEIELVEIGGHTNNLPPDEYCDQLSEKRAKAVYTYLLTKGVAPERLRYHGYGKRKPIASNETAAGRQKNQRVEIKILEVRQ